MGEGKYPSSKTSGTRVQEGVQEPVTVRVFQIHWCVSLLLPPRLDSLPHTGLHTAVPPCSAPTEPLTSSALYVECLHCSSLKKPIQLSAELLSLKGLVSWVQSQCLATWVAACGNPTQHTTLDRLFLRNNSGTSLVWSSG